MFLNFYQPKIPEVIECNLGISGCFYTSINLKFRRLLNVISEILDVFGLLQVFFLETRPIEMQFYVHIIITIAHPYGTDRDMFLQNMQISAMSRLGIFMYSAWTLYT